MALQTLFPPADPDCVNLDEHQTYDMFVEMGKRKPNLQGTGRSRVTPKRNKVLMLYFGSEKNKPSCLPSISAYLSAILLMDVDLEVQMNAINLKEKTFTLDDSVYDIDTTALSPPPKKKIKKTSRNQVLPVSVDVFSLFDVLVHRAKEPYCSIVGLFDCELTEDGCPVMGRACGDGVCCISLPLCNATREKMATISHEVLHTLGVDHNTLDRCVMNPISCDEEWLFFSLPNIQKVQRIHNEAKSCCAPYQVLMLSDEKPKDFFKEYHAGLLKAFLPFGKDFENDRKWLRKVLNL